MQVEPPATGFIDEENRRHTSQAEGFLRFGLTSKPLIHILECLRSPVFERRPLEDRLCGNAEMLAKMEVEDMLRRHGDSFVELAPKVKELRVKNPSLSLEDAYRLTHYEKLQKTSREEGAVHAQQANEQAQKAQVESSRPSGYRPLNMEEAIENKNIPTEEIVDALGPEYGAFKAKYQSLRKKK